MQLQTLLTLIFVHSWFCSFSSSIAPVFSSFSGCYISDYIAHFVISLYSLCLYLKVMKKPIYFDDREFKCDLLKVSNFQDITSFRASIIIIIIIALHSIHDSNCN